MTTPATPTFLQPSAPGQLSNYFGANTGGDKITLQARYTNPEASTEGLGSVRVVATRQRLNAAISETAWDSWYSSTGNIQALPATANCWSPNCSAVYGGRVYVYALNGASAGLFYSAPIAGNSIGTWRIEQGIPYTVGGAYLPVTSIVIINGFIYAYTVGGGSTNVGFGVYYAALAAGVVGTWTKVTASGIAVNTNNAVTGYSDTTGAWLIQTANSTASYTTLSATGAIGTWATVSNLPRNATDGMAGGALFIQPSGANDGKATLWVIGGATGAATTNPIATISSAALTSGNITGAFTSAANGLPAARSNFGFAVGTVGSDTANPNDYQLVVIGGQGSAGNAYSSSANAPPATGQQTTVYKLSANNLSLAWTTVGGALGTAVDGIAGAFVGNLPGIAWGVADVYGIGGNAAGTLQTNIQHSHWTGAFPAFTNGSTGNAVVAGDFGTGAILTSNPSGTVDLTWLWNAWGVTALLSLLNGDTVTVAVTLVSTKGDPSPTGYTVFKVGQPPTISGISVTPSGDGAPLITFNYNGGLGGASEQYWRIQGYPVQPYSPVTPPVKRWIVTRQAQFSGIATQALQGKRGQRFLFPRKVAVAAVFDPPGISTALDSGTIIGNANSWQTQPAPDLAPGVQYQVWVTTASQDVPMSGSTNVGSAGALITPTGTAPGQPTGTAVVVDNTNAYMTLTWTNAADANPIPYSNRIYYRVTGTTAWTLYKDNVPAPVGGAQGSYILMDQILIDGTSYDFYVSSVSSAHMESAAAGAATATGAHAINYQWPNGFSAMLHIAGAGSSAANHEALFLPHGLVKITRQQDSQADVYFGDTAARYRYGIYSYREIEFALSQTIAVIPGVDQIINAAYAGQTLCYRDVAGNLIYCGFGGSRPRVYDYYADETLKLTEAAFVYAP